MKKFFSKALSLVLTLALLATVFSFVGVTASAAKNISELVENNSKKVYFIDFNDIVANEGEVLARVEPADLGLETLENSMIMISYSYYLKAEKHNDNNMHDEIYVRNWGAGSKDSADTNVPNMLENNQTYLRDGMGKFMSVYTCPSSSFVYGASLQQHNGPTSAELYIWDISISVNGVAVDTNPINVSKTGYGDNAKIDVSVVSYEDMFNAQKAWKISLNNVQNDKCCSFSNFNYANRKVTVEFDYYYEAPTASGQKLNVMDIAGKGFTNIKQDNADGDTFLRPGQHRWSGVIESAGSTTALALQVVGNIASAEVYVWNLSIYLTSDVGTENEQTWRQVRNADFSHSYSSATNADNGFTVVEANYGDLMATRKAYRLDYSKVAAANSTSGWCFSSTQMGTNELVVSFNYKVVGAVTNDAIATQDISGGQSIEDTNGDNKGSYYLIADGNEHYYEYVGTDTSGGQFYFRLNLGSYTQNTNVTVYVWNLVLRQTADFHNRQNLMTNAFNGEEKNKPFDNVECTYADVVAETPVMLLDFADAEAELGEKNEVLNAKYALQRAGRQMGPDDNDADISIYFDYYLADAGKDEIKVYNVAGGDMSDDKTGTDSLQPGRHTFSITGKKLSYFGIDREDTVGNLYTAVALADPNVDSNAKLYIWNLELKVYYEDHSEKFGAYNAGLYGESDKVGPEATMVEYADIENKFDANNDGVTNVLDLIRAKRAMLYTYVSYDKANLGYAALNAETLVAMKKAVLA